MNTVTDDFLAAQSLPGNVGVRRIQYKRRKWNTATLLFEWETDWTELASSEILSVSSVQSQLDTDQQNEFKVSNVTLIVDDSDNKWRPDNPVGIFGQDSNSTLHRYEPYWMKFRVQAGYELADGTSEYLTLFTGLAVDYIAESEKRTTQIMLQGLEIILMNAKAEGIATTVTNENKGVGNSVTTVFTTTNPGVGGITEVSLNGTTKIEGSDYTVGNLNVATGGATVTFAVAPTAAQTVRISYFYWPQSQTFKTVIQNLLTYAGVASGNQQVENVVFQNNVFDSHTYTNQADYDAGTKTRIETAIAPGTMRIDWSDTSFRETQTWGESLSGWGSSTFTSDGTQITSVAPSGGIGIPEWSRSISRPYSRILGPLEIKFKFDNNVTSGHGISVTHGFSILVDAGGSISCSGSSNTWAADSSYHTLKVIRSGVGRILVYLDDVLKLDVTNQEFTSANSLFLGHSGTTKDGTTQASFKNIVTPIATVTANWISAALDMGGTPTGWGQLLHTFTGTGMSIATKTSADNITYDSLLDLNTVTNLPQSTLRRYIKTNVSWSVDTTSTQEPQVQDLTISWVTTSTTILLPAFTGDSVYDALQKLGEFTNYEFGFDQDENFFFRPKQSGDSQMSIDQSNFIARVLSYDKGDARVYGSVRAQYGSFVKEVTGSGQEPKSTRARVLDNRLDITPDSNIQITATADVASGIAQGFFRYFSTPRRRVKVETKFLPQFQLSDPITVTILNRTPNPYWLLGDDSVYLGQEGVYFWGEREQLIYNTLMKVVAIRHDIQKFTSEIELEEAI